MSATGATLQGRAHVRAPWTARGALPRRLSRQPCRHTPMPGSAAAGVLRCYRQNDAERGADEARTGDCGTEAEGRVVDESKHERAGGEDAGAHEAAHEAEAAIAKVDALTAGGEEGEGARGPVDSETEREDSAAGGGLAQDGSDGEKGGGDDGSRGAGAGSTEEKGRALGVFGRVGALVVAAFRNPMFSTARQFTAVSAAIVNMPVVLPMLMTQTAALGQWVVAQTSLSLLAPLLISLGFVAKGAAQNVSIMLPKIASVSVILWASYLVCRGASDLLARATRRGLLRRADVVPATIVVEMGAMLGGGVMSLAVLGVSISSMVIPVGCSLAFATRDIAANVVSGLQLVAGGVVQPGRRVGLSVGGQWVEATCESVNLRTVTLRCDGEDGGSILNVPNAIFLRKEFATLPTPAQQRRSAAAALVAKRKDGPGKRRMATTKAGTLHGSAEAVQTRSTKVDSDGNSRGHNSAGRSASDTRGVGSSGAQRQ